MIERAEPERSIVARRDEATQSVVARARWARVGLLVSALLIAASFLYPLTATVPRLRQRFEGRPGSVASFTLHANDWMRYGTVPSVGPSGNEPLSFAEDRDVIDWFNRAVPGSPVVAEASIGPYRCNGSRISIGTGLPTIIGWERHERQQRAPEGLSERVADVEELYQSTDPTEKAAILRRYDVAYVVVGDLERRYPAGVDGCPATDPAAGIAAFDEMLGESLDLAFQSGETRVYRVLPASPGGTA